MRVKILAAIAALTVTGGAHAAVVVTNGDFATTTLPVATLQSTNHSGAEIGADYIYGQALTGWNSSIGSGSAFNLYFFGDGSEATKEADTQYGELGQHPNANYTGACNLTGCGGAFMVLDGDPGFAGALTQTINGLTAGNIYTVSFFWAAGELADRKGYISDRLDVNFGGDLQSTADFFNSTPYFANPLNAPGDFSGWSKVNMKFTAHSASQVLSFLSIGTPAANLPPVAFLDGVSISGAPEPAVWGMMVLGFGALGASLRRRRRPATA